MKFVKLLKQLRLTAEEKEKSRGFLIARMGLDPVRNSGVGRHSFWKVPFFPAFLTNKYMVTALIAAVLLAFGGGTAAAAENSLPGDLLYPVKVNINEEVKSALSLSAETKAAWDARRAERRLEEAEKLAVAEKLAQPTAEQLAERFHKYAEKMEDRLERIEESGKLSPEKVEELKANFEASLKAHGEIIARMQEKEQERIVPVWNLLKDQASSTIRARLEREARLLSEEDDEQLAPDRRESAENRLNAAKQKIDEVARFFINNTDKVTEEVQKEALEKLDEARKMVAEGEKDLVDGKFAEAFIKFAEAHRQAQEAKMYFIARLRLPPPIRPVGPPTMVSSSDSGVAPVIMNDAESGFREIREEIRGEAREAKEKRRIEFREDIKEIEEKLLEEIKESHQRALELRREKVEEFNEDLKERRREIGESVKLLPKTEPSLVEPVLVGPPIGPDGNALEPQELEIKEKTENIIGPESAPL